MEIDADNQLVSNPIFFSSGHDPETEVASTKTASSPASDPPSASTATESSAPLPVQEETSPVAEAAPLVVAPIVQFVEVTGRGVRLRKEPSTQSPVVGRAEFGDRLLFVRQTEVMLSGKPWIVIQKDGNPAYIWEGLIKAVPTD